MIWIALGIIYVVWGSTYLAIRVAVETLPPFSMAAIRFLIAGALLYIWAKVRRTGPASGREWQSAALLGLFLLVGGVGGVSWAEQRVASGQAAVLIATTPLWMVLLDIVRPSGSWPGWTPMAGVAVGFIGSALLVGPFPRAGSLAGVDMVGGLILLLAALSWSIGSVYNRTAMLPKSPVLASAMQMLAGGIGLAALATLTGEWQRVRFSEVSRESVLALTYLIIFGSLVAFSAYVWLLRVASISLVASHVYVNPVVAVLLGWFLAGEPFTIRIAVATVLIVGSILLVSKPTAHGRGEPATSGSDSGR
jgi:drug/metabolite transporter (DMT)-like permease